MISAAMEDYIKTIYHLQKDTDGQVQTSAVASELDVTAPTVTNMLEKLEEQELIDREKYAGVALTARGKQVALEVIRHHRLIEAYLTEQLDYSWTEVHEEADRLEHHISEKFEKRLAAQLDDPETDPHGDPIPDASLQPPEADSGVLLTELSVGTQAVVEQITDQQPETLEYLSSHGVTPGAELIISEIAPFGMVTVTVEAVDQQVSLPETVAKSVKVTPAEVPDSQLS